MDQTNYRGRSRSGSNFRNSKPKYSYGRSGGRRNAGKSIDSNRFIKAARPSEQTVYIPKHSFADFELHDLLKTNLDAKGYKVPTQIQDMSIPMALEGKDIIGIANTGTGKTAAFLLPLLNKLISHKGQRILIVAPTRELALQIEQECRDFAKNSGLFGVLLIGGVPIGAQLRDLRSSPEIVIGTPGRIKDHLERGTLKLNDVTNVVLDEVDRMLDMGFIVDIKTILAKLPAEKQALFFSATLSPTIERLINDFTDSPVSVMAKTAETSDNVDQSVIRYNASSEKIDKLHELLIAEGVQKALIFGETKRSVERLSNELVSRGFKAEAMHGDKTQGQRQRALSKFREDRVNILVATDVAARGIDVDGITHVVNYDLPQTYDDYTHRIGRAGRAGNKGYAVTFVTH
jgi:superfamily II DNA/RNA helicase